MIQTETTFQGQFVRKTTNLKTQMDTMHRSPADIATQPEPTTGLKEPQNLESVVKPAATLEFEVVEDRAVPVASSASDVNAVDKQADTSSDERDYHRLNDEVLAGYSSFIKSGLALKEIRERELWRHGGFPNWAAYCKSYEGMSKRHADRLISSAGIAVELSKAGPIGLTLPYAESQVRPLAKLPGTFRRLKAWGRAVDRASGGQPTGDLVKTVVAEMTKVAAAPPPDKTTARPFTKRVDKYLQKLSKEFEGSADPKEFEPLLAKLREVAIRVDKGVAKAATSDSGAVVTRHDDGSDGEEDSEADAADTGIDPGISEGVGSGERVATTPAKSRGKAAHSRPRGTRRAVVIEECNSRPPESPGKPPVGEIPRSDHMTARLLHAVLQSPIDYDGWLAEAQRDRPDYFIIPNGGGDALIALEWAKAVAFHADNSASSRLALNLIVKALNECPVHKGADADALFTEALAISGPEPTAGEDLQILYGGLVGGSGFKPSAWDAEQNF